MRRNMVLVLGILLLFMNTACAVSTTPVDKTEDGKTETGIQLFSSLTLENEEIAASLREEMHGINEKVIAALQENNLDRNNATFSSLNPNISLGTNFSADLFPSKPYFLINNLNLLVVPFVVFINPNLIVIS